MVNLSVEFPPNGIELHITHSNEAWTAFWRNDTVPFPWSGEDIKVLRTFSTFPTGGFLEPPAEYFLRPIPFWDDVTRTFPNVLTGMFP